MFRLIESFNFHHQLGIAIGFVTPPMLVKNHDSLDLIGADLKFLFTSVAAFTSILVVLVVICKYFQHFLRVNLFWSFWNYFLLQFFKKHHRLHHQHQLLLLNSRNQINHLLSYTLSRICYAISIIFCC